MNRVLSQRFTASVGLGLFWLVCIVVDHHIPHPILATRCEIRIVRFPNLNVFEVICHLVSDLMLMHKYVNGDMTGKKQNITFIFRKHFLVKLHNSWHLPYFVCLTFPEGKQSVNTSIQFYICIIY